MQNIVGAQSHFQKCTYNNTNCKKKVTKLISEHNNAIVKIKGQVCNYHKTAE